MGLKDILVSEIKKNVSSAIGVDETVDIVPTNIKLLDLILGGGIPVGKVISIVGKPHAGKSTITMQIAKSFQDTYPDSMAIFIDTEHSVSVDRLERMGVDMDRAVIFTKDVDIENVAGILETLIDTKIKEGLTDVPFLVVWDSIAATGSKKAKNIDKIEQMTGFYAKYLSFLMKRFVSELAAQNITLITINQLRKKIEMGYTRTASDLRFLGDEKLYGGYAYKFHTFTGLYLRPVSPEFTTGENTSSSAINAGFNGTSVLTYAYKNKLFMVHTKINLVLDYFNGFSDLWTNFLFLKDRKIIVSSGGWWKLDDYKFRLKELETKYISENEFKLAFDNHVLDEIQKFKQSLETSHPVDKAIVREVLDETDEVEK